MPLFASTLDPKFQEKVAFTDHSGQNFTYAQLGRKGLGLATELRSKVKGREEERIAFLCDRNFNFPTTLVATWMSRSIGKEIVVEVKG